MLSEKELQALRELEAKAPGELRYWPTHYMGTTPYIVAEGIGYGGKLFVAMGENGKTANTELRGYEGDRAIAYAKRMTMAANALPHLLKRIEELEAALAPFAAVGAKLDGDRPSDNVYARLDENGEAGVKVRDFRRARKVLRKVERA